MNCVFRYPLIRSFLNTCYMCVVLSPLRTYVLTKSHILWGGYHPLPINFWFYSLKGGCHIKWSFHFLLFHIFFSRAMRWILHTPTNIKDVRSQVYSTVMCCYPSNVNNLQRRKKNVTNNKHFFFFFKRIILQEYDKKQTNFLFVCKGRFYFCTYCLLK